MACLVLSKFLLGLFLVVIVEVDGDIDENKDEDKGGVTWGEEMKEVGFNVAARRDEDENEVVKASTVRVVLWK